MIQLNEHESGIRKTDPGVIAGMQKKGEFEQNQFIDEFLGIDKFVKVPAQPTNEE